MGVICARGYFIPDKLRIVISLEFHPGAYKGGDTRDKIKVLEKEYNPKEVLPEIHEKIKDDVGQLLPNASMTNINSLGISVDCSVEKEAYKTIFQAYRRQITGKGLLPLPTRIKSQPKAIVRKFIRG